MDINVPREGDSTLTFTEKAFRSSIAAILSALTMSGTTANRPIAFLWLGRPYWDTTLGLNIRVKQLNPVLWARYDGTTV